MIATKGLYMDDFPLRNQLAPWEKAALEKFEKKMTDNKKPFPCIPATIGFSLNQLCYGFAGDPREDSTLHKHHKKENSPVDKKGEKKHSA